MTTALFIQPNGTADLIRCGDYQDIRFLVGGDLEGIYGPGWTAYCDEDGKRKNLPFNESATQVAVRGGWDCFDVLRGNVLFVGAPTPNGDDTNVPSDLIHYANTTGV